MSVLVVFPYIIKTYNNKKSNQKVVDLETKHFLKFYKILNKKCSIKRLSSFAIVDKNLMFERCNILVENNFIIVQGIKTFPLNSIVRNFIITDKPENLLAIYSSWEIIKPLEIEMNIKKTEIKIIFKPTKSISNSNYSLIISDLTSMEYGIIEKTKNYC